MARAQIPTKRWLFIAQILAGLVVLFLLLGTVTYETDFGWLIFEVTLLGSAWLGIPLGILNVALGIAGLVAAPVNATRGGLALPARFAGVANILLGLLSFLLCFMWASYT